MFDPCITHHIHHLQVSRLAGFLLSGAEASASGLIAIAWSCVNALRRWMIVRVEGLGRLG